MNDTITFTTPDYTYTVWPEVGRYSNGRLAISFWDEEGPCFTLTTNLPDKHLNEDEIFVKDWSENEPLVKALLEQGWIFLTGREVSSGFVFPKVAKQKGHSSTFSIWGMTLDPSEGITLSQS